MAGSKLATVAVSEDCKESYACALDSRTGLEVAIPSGKYTPSDLGSAAVRPLFSRRPIDRKAAALSIVVDARARASPSKLKSSVQQCFRDNIIRRE